MTDARFEDGAEAPLSLVALDPEDLRIVASLVQDAIFPILEMRYQTRERRFAILLNRFRWEDRDAATRTGRAFERVRAMLVIEGVLAVRTQGIDRGDKDTVLSLLDIAFEPGADGAGSLVLTLAGDGAIALDVEMVEVTLRDVTRPYRAPSGKAPIHPE